jgi:serine/threonine protein kinase/WD40 repeat protein
VSDEIDLGIEGLRGYREVDSGGFADVYEAEDQFGRRVAVKVLKALDERGRRRFDRERSAMGLVAGHPHVVTPFTAGYTDVGSKPYVVMEHMGGGSLQKRLEDSGPLPVGEAVGLVIPIAEALGHSHGAGLIHKDIKPANILLSDDGVPKLADFGIASIRDATQTTSMAYSPEYTPPELFHSSGSASDDPRDERSDWYSLGATLYALVAGQGPFHSDTNPSPAGYMARILTDPTPSTGHVGLDQFLVRAMAKDPDDRYQNTTQFITALEAITTPPGHDPEPPSDPTPAIEAPPDDELPRPSGDREVSTATTVAVATPDPALLATEHDGTRSGEEDAPIGADRPSRVRAASMAAAGLVALGAVLAVWWTQFRPEESRPRQSATYAGHEGPVWAVAELADGRIASASFDSTVQVWDPSEPDTPLATYTGHGDWVRSVVELADGQVASASRDGTVQIWNPDDPESTSAPYTGHTGGVWAIVELSDGRIASASFDGTVQVWDPDEPAVIHATYAGHANRLGGIDFTAEVWAVTELADGRIASASADATVQIWHPDEPASTQATYTGHTAGVWAVTELADGRIASAGADATVQIWHPDEPASTQATYTGHTGAVRSVVELSGGWIASASADGTIQIWDPEDSANTEAVYTGHTDAVRSVTELSDGWIASAGADGTVQIWDPTDP